MARRLAGKSEGCWGRFKIRLAQGALVATGWGANAPSQKPGGSAELPVFVVFGIDRASLKARSARAGESRTVAIKKRRRSNGNYARSD